MTMTKAELIDQMSDDEIERLTDDLAERVQHVTPIATAKREGAKGFAGGLYALSAEDRRAFWRQTAERLDGGEENAASK